MGTEKKIIAILPFVFAHSRPTWVNSRSKELLSTRLSQPNFQLLLKDYELIKVTKLIQNLKLSHTNITVW